MVTIEGIANLVTANIYVLHFTLLHENNEESK